MAGHPAAGKTTIAKRLATDNNCTIISGSSIIEEETVRARLEGKIPGAPKDIEKVVKMVKRYLKEYPEGSVKDALATCPYGMLEKMRKTMRPDYNDLHIVLRWLLGSHFMADNIIQEAKRRPRKLFVFENLRNFCDFEAFMEQKIPVIAIQCDVFERYCRHLDRMDLTPEDFSAFDFIDSEKAEYSAPNAHGSHVEDIIKATPLHIDNELQTVDETLAEVRNLIRNKNLIS